MISYSIVYFGFIFLLAWPLDAIWRYFKTTGPETANFYYHRSFWIILMILFFLLPIISMLSSVIT